MTKTKEEIIRDIQYLFSRINWKESYLDAKAIGIMNTVTMDILNLEEDKVE